MRILSALMVKLCCAISLLTIASIAALGIFLSKDKVLSPRHQPYQVTQDFDFKSGTFENYILYSQNRLRQARLDNPTDTIIKNASPFMLEPAAACLRDENGRVLNGIVLTHGLIASPYSMRPIAEYFQSRCFYVLAILLPDHASRPGDLIDTRWQSWAETQRFALNILQQKVVNVLLSGHSMGAELAAYEAAINPQVKGLVLFSPGMQITPAAKYAKYLSWLGWIFPKAAWFEVRDDLSRYRYESVPFSAARESFELIMATDRVLRPSALAIPILTVASVEDNTVNTDATLAFMAKQTHPASKTILYSQHPIPSSAKVKVVNSAAPKQGVLSVSHLGIMLPASHAEYGRDGAYRYCGHYFNSPDKWAMCKEGKRDYYGEVTPENLKQGLIERIAFNPFYEELLDDLDEFIAGLDLNP